MKKQILFLAIFTLAIFLAGTTKVLGQPRVYKNYVESATPQCTPALTLSCAGTVAGAPELSPVAGVPYNYTISAAPATVQDVLWFVTNDVNVISTTTNLLTTTRDPGDGTGSYVATSGPANVYNNTTATPNTALTVNISWKNFDGNTNTVLLVAYVKGAAGCTDNIEVWRIRPIFVFTLDVLSLADNGILGSTATPASECVSPVESALFVPAATAAADRLTMDYGRNFIFYSVNAANFVGSWLPSTLTAAATAGMGQVINVSWAYPTEAIENTGGATAVASGDWHPATKPVVKQNVVAGDSVVGPTGQCIIVRVEVDNVNIESPVNAEVNAVTLSVNGIMRDAGAGGYANNSLRDVDEPVSGTGACVQDRTDTGIFNITARPDITAVSPVPFVTKQ